MNRYDELWALMELAKPGILGTFAEFNVRRNLVEFGWGRMILHVWWINELTPPLKSAKY